jgi:hypothetical protein
LEAARAAHGEIGKAMDSLAFCPPEGEIVHVKRAVDAMNQLAQALKLDRPKGDRPPNRATAGMVIAPNGSDAVKQAEVDAGLVTLMRKYIGVELTGFVRTKMEREAREYLDECRARKLVAYKEVDVRVGSVGDVHVEYFK